MQWAVYILECGDGTFYTGITNDLKARLAKHAAGTAAKYTKGRGPFQLRFSETQTNRSAASKREAEIKALTRQQKLALLHQKE